MNEERYSKQIKLAGFGRPAQYALEKAAVLIVGAGGLGTPCAQYLNAMGVGTIGMVDADTISLSNLPRQTLYNEAETGQLKLSVLSKKLAAQNPATNIICYNTFLTVNNALSIINNFHLVIDCSDNFGTRYLVNDSCVLLNKPLIYGAVDGFEGQVSVLNYCNGPTYRCIFPEDESGQSTVLNCDEQGVPGAVPALIGTYQAMEAIKVLTGIGNPLSGTLLIIDTLSQSHFKIAVKPIAANRAIAQLRDVYAVPVCRSDVQSIDHTTLDEWIQAGKKMMLIDVRTLEEFGTTSSLGAINIPLNELEQRLDEIDFSSPVITICQTGARSVSAALLLLKENSQRKIFSLHGGLSLGK